MFAVSHEDDLFSMSHISPLLHRKVEKEENAFWRAYKLE